MSHAGYKQFCPLAMAAEVLCTRWTMVLLREMIAGSTRFNDLRRGVPKMSPTLLSKRLKDLEDAGIVERRPVPSEHGVLDYHLTEAGRDLRDVVIAMGMWGAEMGRILAVAEEPRPVPVDVGHAAQPEPRPLPNRRTVVQFLYHDLPTTKRDWWLVIEPSGEVDLYPSTGLRTMTAIWMGITDVAAERARIELTGSREIAATLQTWLGLSPFAVQKKIVA